MNNLFNKKGGAIFALNLAAAIIAGVSILAVPFMTPKFRVKKAVAKCISAQQISEDACESAVAGMSKDEILAYIKDDVQDGNQGNL